MPSTVLSTRELGRATLARQLLLERHSLPVAEAISRLAGMQAQERGPPQIGLRTRLEEHSAGRLLDAYEDRSVVRATMMRGTLHLIPAKDYLRLRSALDAIPRPTMVYVDDDPAEREHLMLLAADEPVTFDRDREAA